MLVVSNMFGMLVTMAAPKKDDELGPGLDLRLFTLLLSPVASAFGIWVVGNIGREQGSFKWPLIGCFTAFLPYVFGNASYSIVTLSGAIFFHWKTKTWRRTIEKPMPFWKKFFYLFICCKSYLVLHSYNLCIMIHICLFRRPLHFIMGLVYLFQSKVGYQRRRRSPVP